LDKKAVDLRKVETKKLTKLSAFLIG